MGKVLFRLDSSEVGCISGADLVSCITKFHVVSYLRKVKS